MSDKIEAVKTLVAELLCGDKSGHGDEHVIRVYELALKFCQSEDVDRDIVALSALLHDADDYKIFGEQSAKNLTNAHNIMNKASIDQKTQECVADIITNMGYSKLLSGTRPKIFEGQIVSDADMCDAIGSIGILRWHQYVLSHDSKVFDPEILPQESISVDEYKKQCSSNGQQLVGGNPINHYFDKLLKLKSLMLTEAGKKEGSKRQQIMIDFLYEFFRENNQPKWIKLLDDFLR